MRFHRWPFIERGLFGNSSGFIWSVNRERISLSVRLVWLGVSLTIMVSCSLEAPVPPLFPFQHQSYRYVLSGSIGFFFPAIFLSTSGWSHWYSLCNKIRLEIVLGSYVISSKNFNIIVMYYFFINKMSYFYLFVFLFLFYISICINFTNLKA